MSAQTIIQVTAPTLNVRSGPGTSYDIVTTIPQYSQWYVLSISGSWYKLADGQWISSSYTKKSIKIKSVQITSTELNIRKGPETSYSIVSILTKDTVVDVIEVMNNGWYKINNYEYIYSEYTKDVVFPIFSYSAIPSDVKSRMLGLSMPLNQPISFDSLSYLKLSYFGFDNRYHVGEMVVDKRLASEVVAIFSELLKANYPIDKIRLIDDYNADDNLSMYNNNTSSFCYRATTDGSSLSKHALGLAIDINPVQNPYVLGSTILPTNGVDYVNRTNVRKGMIIKGDICYKSFTTRGWSWGGSWNSPKDYQHFQKSI